MLYQLLHHFSRYAWRHDLASSDLLNTSCCSTQLYATYTSGFEEAMKLLTHLMGKEKKLDTAVKEFEVGKGHKVNIKNVCENFA